ncbi:hypothetical protein [Streptomyces sp. TLI_105]|uniref:hypothetical protein n=1 Tax=Streptomyces sp. TLI_105 TaxID=1881019 RepID=UPI00089B640E|nr:hypothetical protein [Streptomyces sp. TLI_105]SEE25263.1 hypothetical protein SAMN05428939_7884 [Streptomyces sp. TLI_105]
MKRRRGDLPNAPYINVGGYSKIQQSNGAVVEANIVQQGDHLSGYCTHHNGQVHSTEVTGTVTGQHVDFYITWDDHTKGHSWGDLQAGFFTGNWEGILKGGTQDVLHPNVQATWEVQDRVFQRLVPA